MKIIDLLNIKDNKEVVKEQRKELVFKKSERKITGLRLYEYNTLTKEINEAKFIQVDNIIDFTQPDPARHFLSKIKVLIKDDCVYIQAINKKNALKKVIIFPQV